MPTLIITFLAAIIVIAIITQLGSGGILAINFGFFSLLHLIFLIVLIIAMALVVLFLLKRQNATDDNDKEDMI